ncbi:RNA polymerase sigma factor, sigma-70 family [Gracilibacillus orientalis]|uniref:RNA polymerase sigma factor, sigma-70 family n=1 Tax=Gracilibacillus orientalis TaxID=334253 RepID=A0A1I4L6C2_9BACI|nr:RNA polymerase sigma factor [Gracilibacillus orientalis]SFL86585.1 RNA polymerase sigma factor, sigma-70 family [Gracilibacillus orientalis]
MGYKKGGGSIIQDEQLIRKIKVGNQHAIRLLIERYKHHVFKVIYSVVHDEKIAEDLAQETFIKMIDALTSYQYKGFKTWISRIALHKAIDYKRKITRHKEDLETFEEFEPASTEIHPDEQIISKDKSNKIQQQINLMPEKFRIVVKAYYFQELSYKQIAQELNIEETTVKMRLYRARKWMKENWKEEDFN